MQNWDDNNDYRSDYEDNGEPYTPPAQADDQYPQPHEDFQAYEQPGEVFQPYHEAQPTAIAPIEESSSSSQVSNEDFLRQAYHDLLGREPDEGGAQWWGQALASGTSREDIITSFQNSDEYKARQTVAMGYQEPVHHQEAPVPQVIAAAPVIEAHAPAPAAAKAEPPQWEPLEQYRNQFPHYCTNSPGDIEFRRSHPYGEFMAPPSNDDSWMNNLGPKNPHANSNFGSVSLTSDPSYQAGWSNLGDSGGWGGGGGWGDSRDLGSSGNGSYDQNVGSNSESIVAPSVDTHIALPEDISAELGKVYDQFTSEDALNSPNSPQANEQASYFSGPRDIGGNLSAAELSKAIDTAYMAPADHILTVHEMVQNDPTFLQPSVPFPTQPAAMGDVLGSYTAPPAIELAPGVAEILYPDYSNVSKEPLAAVAVTVHSGDNLERIAERNGTSTAEILRLNPDLAANPDRLKVGQDVIVQPWSNYDHTNDDSKPFGQIVTEARLRGETTVNYQGQSYATFTKDEVNKAAATLVSALAQNLSADGRGAVDTTVKDQITSDAYARTAQGAQQGNVAVVTNNTVNLGVSEANVQASFDRTNKSLDAMIMNASSGTDALLAAALAPPKPTAVAAPAGSAEPLNWQTATLQQRFDSAVEAVTKMPGGQFAVNIVKAGIGFTTMAETELPKVREYLANNSVNQVLTDGINALIPKGGSGIQSGDASGYTPIDYSNIKAAPNTMPYAEQMSNVGNAVKNGAVNTVDALIIHPLVEGAKAGYSMATEQMTADEALKKAGAVGMGLVTAVPFVAGGIKAVSAGAEVIGAVRTAGTAAEAWAVESGARVAAGAGTELVSGAKAVSNIGRVDNIGPAPTVQIPGNTPSGIVMPDGSFIPGNYVREVPTGSVPRLTGSDVEIPGGSVPRLPNMTSAAPDVMPSGSVPRLGYVVDVEVPHSVSVPVRNEVLENASYVDSGLPPYRATLPVADAPRSTVNYVPDHTPPPPEAPSVPRAPTMDAAPTVPHTSIDAAPSAPTPVATLPDDLDWEAWIRGDTKAPAEHAPTVYGDPRVISSSPPIAEIFGETCGARAVRMNNELAGLDVPPLAGNYTRMDFERSFGTGSVAEHATQESVISQIAKAKEGDSFIIGIQPKDPTGTGHAINAQVVDGRVVFRDPGLDGKYVSNDLGMFTSGLPENYTFFTVNGSSANPVARLTIDQPLNFNSTPIAVQTVDDQMAAIDNILGDFKPPQTSPVEVPRATIPEDWNQPVTPVVEVAPPPTVVPFNRMTPEQQAAALDEALSDFATPAARRSRSGGNLR